MRATALLATLMLAGPGKCWDFDLSDFLEAHQKGLEISLTVLLSLVLVNYLMGKSQNEGLFLGFLRETFPVFRRNFPVMGNGFSRTSEAPRDPLDLLSDTRLVATPSPTNLNLSFAGRKSVQFCQVNVFAKRRQNLMVNLFYSLFVEEKDQLLVEVVLRKPNLPSGCLYVVKAKKQSWVKDKFDDVRMLCKRQEPGNFQAKGFTVWGENIQISEWVINHEFSTVFTTRGDLVESFELSDCLTNELHGGTNLKLQLNLGRRKREDWDAVNTKIEQFLSTADRLAAYSPPREILADLRENRLKFWEQQEQNKWLSRKKLADRRQKMVELAGGPRTGEIQNK